MRKLLVVAVVSGLIVGSVATAEAGKKKKPPKRTTRVAEATYSAPARFYTSTGSDNIGGAAFATGAGETYVSVTIEDDLGMDVSAAVGQDPEGDTTVDTTDFCTSTEEPLPITPGIEVTVFVFVGPCTSPSPAPAFATQGKIVTTFSNMP